MNYRCAAVLLLLLVAACAGPELGTTNEERLAAMESSAESRAHHLATRIEWAQSRATEYQERVDEAEHELGTQRGILRVLRAENARLAAELLKIRTETDRLTAELDAARELRVSGQAELDRLQQTATAFPLDLDTKRQRLHEVFDELQIPWPEEPSTLENSELPEIEPPPDTGPEPAAESPK
ncbi:MAG: hypothetical protein KDB53_09685 [Planctomycetes bacterium]|nr:hypothetical protein [Planctomycetota bacterium]